VVGNSILECESEKVNPKVISAFFVLISGMMLLALAFPRGNFVLVVGRPGQTEARIVEIVDRARGSYVSGSEVEWIGVAYSNAPDFTSRLMKSGAFLVLNYSFAAGCAGESKNERT
jgi:hypothetical protein